MIQYNYKKRVKLYIMKGEIIMQTKFKKQMSFLLAVIIFFSLTFSMALPVNAKQTMALPLIKFPKITQQPTDKSITAGENTSFYVGVDSGSFIITYKWQEQLSASSYWHYLADGEKFSGVNTNTLNLTNTSSVDSGSIYRCEIIGKLLDRTLEPQYSNEVKLTVAVKTYVPVITGPATITIPAGYTSTVTENYTVTGTPTATTTKISGESRITWNDISRKLEIAPGIPPGVYQVILKAVNTVGDTTYIITLTITEAGAPPTINGLSQITLNAGYTATSTEAFTITGNPDPTVTKLSGDAKITWNNTTKKLDIAAGLTPGVYQVILKAVNTEGETPFIITVTVAETSASPLITGAAALTLNNGYTATSTEAFTVTGNPAPTVTKLSGDAKITWNNTTKKLDIAAGLTPGVYQVVLKAINSVDEAIFLFTLTITDLTPKPVITGAAALTLNNGYTATSSEAFTVTGNPAPTVTKLSGDTKITWNNSTKKLDIAAGLTAGVYQVVLKAINSVDETTFIFTLTVADSPKPVISGKSEITLTVGYTATSTEVYTITGNPDPTVTKTSGDGKITWNNSTKKLDIAAGLTAGSYQVILKAVNSAGEASLTVTFTVKDNPIPPTTIDKSGMSNFIKIRTYTRGQFTDVDETLWYGFDQLKVIAGAYEHGLMEGNNSTSFNPAGNITVAEAITIAVRVHSIYTTGKAVAPVSDPWYRGYVEYAVINGIINATSFTDFDRAATRAEMAFIFSRAIPMTEFAAINTVNSLPDVNKDTSYSESIFTLYKAGILVGNDDKGTFAPDKNITRNEAAAIISRVILPATRISGKTF